MRHTILDWVACNVINRVYGPWDHAVWELLLEASLIGLRHGGLTRLRDWEWLCPVVTLVCEGMVRLIVCLAFLERVTTRATSSPRARLHNTLITRPHTPPPHLPLNPNRHLAQTHTTLLQPWRLSPTSHPLRRLPLQSSSTATPPPPQPLRTRRLVRSLSRESRVRELPRSPSTGATKVRTVTIPMFRARLT
jgi:hypothetical protein